MIRRTKHFPGFKYRVPTPDSVEDFQSQTRTATAHLCRSRSRAREMTGSVLGAEQEVKIGGWLPCLMLPIGLLEGCLAGGTGSGPVSPIERLEGIPALLDSCNRLHRLQAWQTWAKTWQPTKMWVQLNVPFFHHPGDLFTVGIWGAAGHRSHLTRIANEEICATSHLGTLRPKCEGMRNRG